MKFVLPDSGNAWQEVNIREDADGNIIVDTVSVEDTTEVIESNKRAQAANRQTMGKGTQTSMFKLGEISALQAYELMKQGIFQDDKALRRWFGDLDNYLWRTVSRDNKGKYHAVQSPQDDRGSQK